MIGSTEATAGYQGRGPCTLPQHTSPRDPSEHLPVPIASAVPPRRPRPNLQPGNVRIDLQEFLRPDPERRAAATEHPPEPARAEAQRSEARRIEPGATVVPQPSPCRPERTFIERSCAMVSLS